MAAKSLQDRFKAATAAAQDTTSDLEPSEMGELLCTWGRTYVGKTFADIFDRHPSYISWCLGYFGSSLAKRTAAQSSFLRYVEFRVETLEEEHGITEDEQSAEQEGPPTKRGVSSSQSTEHVARMNQLESQIGLFTAAHETTSTRLSQIESVLFQIVANLPSSGSK